MKKQKYNTTHPLFFLITCVKNGRDYIEKLFDSLLSQTKINFVHYIYEDGSTDSIEDLVQEYKLKASKLNYPFEIIYEKNPINIGLNMSIKHCIDKCELPYFIWVDCDNWVDKNFFIEMEKLAKKHPNAILLRSTNINVKNANGGKIEVIKKMTNKNQNAQLGLLLRRKFYYSFFAVKSSEYKKINCNNVLLDQRGFYDDDQVLFISMIMNGKYALSKKAFGYFYLHNDSESNYLNLDYIKCREYCLTLAKEIGPNIYERAKAFYDIFDGFKFIELNYKNKRSECLEKLQIIKTRSKKNNISLKNFYKGSIIYWRLKIMLSTIRRNK